MMLLALAMLIKYGPLAAIPFPLAAVLVAWFARKFLTGFTGVAKKKEKTDRFIFQRGRCRLSS